MLKTPKTSSLFLGFFMAILSLNIVIQYSIVLNRMSAAGGSKYRVYYFKFFVFDL